MSWSKSPIEDPVRISRFSEVVARLDWAPGAAPASLKELFLGLGELVNAEIKYYYSRRCASRKLSKFCRFLAWALATTGILMPLVQPLVASAAAAGQASPLLSWGYVAFAAAGSVLIFDSLFAGTHAHQRNTGTQLELEKVYTIFALEWQSRIVKLQANPAAESSVLEVLACASAFVTELHRILGAETSAWQDAVNKALAQLKGQTSGKPSRGDAVT